MSGTLRRLRSSVGGISARLLDWRPAAAAREVGRVYSASGGGLLARGLAFDALVALLPGLLLVAGVVGLVVHDPARREELISSLARQLPPLRELVRGLVEGMGAGAVPFTAVGVVGLIWGASRFYGSLDTAFAQVFTPGESRGFLSATVRGVATVAILVLAVGLDLALPSLPGLPSGGGPAPVAAAMRQALAFVGGWAVTFAGVMVVYRAVPRVVVAWRRIVPVAAVVSLVLSIFSDAYSLLAPRLVGAAAVYGTFVAFFGALIWLGWCCQALLLGAAALRPSGTLPRNAEGATGSAPPPAGG